MSGAGLSVYGWSSKVEGEQQLMSSSVQLRFGHAAGKTRNPKRVNTATPREETPPPLPKHLAPYVTGKGRGNLTPNADSLGFK